MMGIKVFDLSLMYDVIKNKFCLIGFLLCVYLYVFEKDIRIIDVFDDLRIFVICYIKNEIDSDKTYSVKILFFFLLFYISLSSFKLKNILDFIYGKDIWEYLENFRVVLKDFVDRMEFLNFENLYVIVKSLRYIILIK